MAANGFPAGEREGGNQNAALDAIPEPLGDVFLGFTCLCMKKFDRCLKRKFGGLLRFYFSVFGIAPLRIRASFS